LISIRSNTLRCCLVLLVLAIAAGGCSSGIPAEAESLEVKIRSIDLGHSIDIMLIPRDAEGFMVKTEGSFDAVMWLQYVFSGEVDHDYLVDEWFGVEVIKDDYVDFQGARIELAYSEEKNYQNIYGSLDVTFTTADGKTLTDTLDYIGISDTYPC